MMGRTPAFCWDVDVAMSWKVVLGIRQVVHFSWHGSPPRKVRKRSVPADELSSIIGADQAVLVPCVHLVDSLGVLVAGQVGASQNGCAWLWLSVSVGMTGRKLSPKCFIQEPHLRVRLSCGMNHTRAWYYLQWARLLSETAPCCVRSRGHCFAPLFLTI